ncbi:hypothetical protein [Thermogemmatispora onikobensis]|uniref:hypothetical protein n=1 Tax=Thermogemmatispora onikobensis TaxID=732234 RepID=UPI000853EA4D|nr:hypothetical protein [Thermogemmatispora onikobensis]
MNLSLLHRLVQAAKRDGLTLQWSLIHLLDRLERYEQRLGYLRYWGGESDAGEVQQLRLDNEALALVLLAALKAYPAGADIALEEQRLPELAALLTEQEPGRRDGQAKEKGEHS